MKSSESRTYFANCVDLKIVHNEGGPLSVRQNRWALACFNRLCLSASNVHSMIRRLKNRRWQRKYAEAYWSMTEDARLSEIFGIDFSHLMCDAKTILLLQNDLTGNPY